MLRPEVLASGYGTTEGPTVDAEGQLYFSDIPRGGVYRWSPEAGVETVIPKRRGVGGICLHRDGGLVVAGRDVSHVRDGETRVLLSREDVAALGGAGAVGGFNDLHADDQGRVLVGSVRLDEAGGRLPGDLVLIRGEHEAQILYSGVVGCNGLALDWASRRLYHSASYGHEIIVSQFVERDRVEIVNRISTADIEGVPDGLALDAEGCVWVAFYRGGCLVRFKPDGEVADRFDLPAREVTSLCFGGEDGRDLFITTEDNTEDPQLQGCVWRTRVEVRGAPVGVATI